MTFCHGGGHRQWCRPKGRVGQQSGVGLYAAEVADPHICIIGRVKNGCASKIFGLYAIYSWHVGSSFPLNVLSEAEGASAESNDLQGSRVQYVSHVSCCCPTAICAVQAWIAAVDASCLLVVFDPSPYLLLPSGLSAEVEQLFDLAPPSRVV